jgi:hypothetical protein
METGGNTEHCYRRGGRRKNLYLPSSRLFTSFIAWRKTEEVVSKEKVELLSLENPKATLLLIDNRNIF